MKLGKLGILTLATALVVQVPLQVHAAGVSKSEAKVAASSQVGATAETAAPITVNHVYNGTVFKTETLTGNVGDTYTAQDLMTQGIGRSQWKLINTTGSETGTFSTEAQTVTYEYQPRLNSMSIQVLFKDIDTDEGIYVHNPFDPTQTQQGKKAFEVITGTPGDTIDFTYQQTYVGMDEGYEYADGTVGTGGSYEFVKESPAIPDVIPVIYPGDPMPTFTLYYKKVSDTNPVVAGQDVTVNYVDTDGNQIADPATLSGNVGDDYTSEEKTIAGYTLTETPANATGTFSDTAQTVTYVYEKDAVAGQDVTVKFVDVDGNELATADVLKGNIGEAFTAVAKTIDGYTLKETPANAVGTFNDAAQTVTYVYEKTAPVDPTDNNDNGTTDDTNTNPTDNTNNDTIVPTDAKTPSTNMNVHEQSNMKKDSTSTKASTPALPKTGDSALDSAILVGLGALLLGALALFTRRQRNAK
ncbi:MucBP domain-containing protein [Listeria sp. ILCC797]|uniref:MucBP domain-containing protein n=1 Tax=Listeria sp. ILCC797 TaxID=1918333 RepID=UPI000B5977D4|nr:MucBP domain-containing protein [Listeria sp. ILCC797]